MAIFIPTIKTSNRFELLPPNVDLGAPTSKKTSNKATQTPSYDKYQTTDLIGQGSTGRVYKAYDLCSLTKIRDFTIKFFSQCSFSEATDHQIQELYFNFIIQDIPHTPKVLYSAPSKNNLPPFIITPYYGPNLQSHTGKLSLDEIEKIAKHLLETLKSLETRGIIHGDITPKNVCFDGTNTTLIDFGSSLMPQWTNSSITITTSWYRAPEAVICRNPYTTSIDMWSLGCLLFELYTGKVLFKSNNEHPITLMNTIVNKLGTPPHDFFLNSLFEKHSEFKNLFCFCKLIPPSKELVQIFNEKLNQEQPWQNKKKAELLLDLINKMITYVDRITPKDAMKHRFFNEWFY